MIREHIYRKTIPRQKGVWSKVENQTKMQIYGPVVYISGNVKG